MGRDSAKDVPLYVVLSHAVKASRKIVGPEIYSYPLSALRGRPSQIRKDAKVRIKIIFQSRDKTTGGFISSEVWSGEWELNTEGEYLSKVSVIAEGVEHPICDIPFGLDIGYWHWYPPMVEENEEEDKNA